MNASLITVVGSIVGIASLILAILNRRGVTRQQRVSRYRDIRHVVKTEQGRLSALAWGAADPAWKKNPVPVLTKSGWILDTPLALDRVRIRRLPKPADTDRIAITASRASRILPPRESRSGHLLYSDALLEIDGLRHLYNGNVYRPVEIKADGVDLSMDFVGGEYFDHLNTSEVLAYEMAAADRRVLKLRRTYRQSMGDPFDLWARATSLGVLTLTIIRECDGPRFLMHVRDSDQVVVGSKAMHVVPAGEFTPASVYLEASSEDFDVWRTIMREYAEELLDREEAYGKEGAGLDYVSKSPYRELNQARRSGKLMAYALGIGLDPLTWKPELFTVCVFDSDAFALIFRRAVKQTWEGTILRGADGKGLRFDADTVNRYADDPNTRRGAAVCLSQAWENRTELGIE
jgi:hypothetical protein